MDLCLLLLVPSTWSAEVGCAQGGSHDAPERKGPSMLIVLSTRLALLETAAFAGRVSTSVTVFTGVCMEY